MVGRILTASVYAFGILLFYVGAGPLVRRLGRKNPKILLYHDCAARETPYTADLDCTTPPATFQAHIDYIRKHYRIVDLETIVNGQFPERAVAITFDDGYASVYENAFPILKEAGAPATIYLISSVVENETLVWVNELNCLLREGGESAVQCTKKHFAISGSETTEQIISHCRLNYRPETMSELLGELRALLQRPVTEHAAEASLYLGWDQIDEMRRAGIEFGNHSRTHPNMERLTDAEQIAEIREAQSDLEKRLPYVRAFAHPFGHKGLATARLALQEGLASAADVGGYNAPVSAEALGRTHLSNESLAGLFSRMELVEPVKGMLRQRLRRQSAAMQ